MPDALLLLLLLLDDYAYSGYRFQRVAMDQSTRARLIDQIAAFVTPRS